VTFSPSAVSVVVSTYNAPDRLEKVLWGYGCQSVTGFELIVADDGSGPETEAVIARHSAHPGLRLQHVWHEDNGFRKCAILNRAIEATSGSYLIFTDGDCVPHRDFVAAHLRLAEEGRFLTGTCSRLPMDLSERVAREDVETGRVFEPLWLLRHGYARTGVWRRSVVLCLGLDGLMNRRDPRDKQTFNGNNASCFRQDALAIGGFDERLGYGGEDREFGYRLEHRGLRAKVIRYSAQTIHLDHPRSYKSATMRAANQVIIDETLATRRVRTPAGLDPASA
jgi:glycosyltransferase involved in cell wall biosynthesis